MGSEHIVKSFDDELKHLVDTIALMGGTAESQVANATLALLQRDTALAAQVIEADARVDQLERDIDQLAIRMLALRQPVASDLRSIVGALRIAGDLERIADYAANLAKRTMALNQVPVVRPVTGVATMSELVQSMIKDVLDAYVARDAAKALEVWRRDRDVDELYNSLFRELLTYMMEDPRSITTCTHLLFIAKNIERMGDHATNIAELIHFLVHGRPPGEARLKGDVTSFVVAGGPSETGSQPAG